MKKSFVHLAIALAIPLFAVSCASLVSETNYQEYRGSPVIGASGGSVRVVEGIDVWETCEPDRPYRVIGTITDTTLDNQGAAPGTLNLLSVMSVSAKSGRVKRIVEKAKEHGADGIILFSRDREFQSQTLHETTHEERQLFAAIKYVDPVEPTELNGTLGSSGFRLCPVF